MEEEKSRFPEWLKIIITAVIILAVIGAAAFFILRGISGSRKNNATATGTGMYGKWVSDYSDCVVTIDEDATLVEINGISKATVICDVEQTDADRYLLTPKEGEFIFADYYIYSEVDGQALLTSYIYLDTQQKVREEYISFYKSAE